MPRGKGTTVRLTKREINSIKPGDQPIRVYDSETTGLSVVVHPSGVRTFMLDYGPRDRRRRMTLGRFGDLTVDDARTEARKLKAQVRAGDDPLDAKRLAREASSFASWSVRFEELGKAENRWCARQLVEVQRHLMRARESFGTRKLADVTADVVERFRNRIHEEYGLATANRTLASVGACLREAWRRGLCPTNEASKVTRLTGELPRTRVLTDDETRKLLAAVEVHPDPVFRVAVLWLMLCGARRSEVLRATWADLQLDDLDAATWTIPRAKNGRPSTRPLPRELATELRRLPRTSLLVLGEWSDYRFVYAWEALREAAGLGADVHLHDLRRTAGLWAARLGGLQVAQRLLGHADISTTSKVYAPLSVDDLRSVQNQATARVLPFRKVESNGQK